MFAHLEKQSAVIVHNIEGEICIFIIIAGDAGFTTGIVQYIAVKAQRGCDDKTASFLRTDKDIS